MIEVEFLNKYEEESDFHFKSRVLKLFLYIIDLQRKYLEATTNDYKNLSQSY